MNKYLNNIGIKSKIALKKLNEVDLNKRNAHPKKLDKKLLSKVDKINNPELKKKLSSILKAYKNKND